MLYSSSTHKAQAQNTSKSAKYSDLSPEIKREISRIMAEFREQVARAPQSKSRLSPHHCDASRFVWNELRAACGDHWLA
jgi:hypothetical protein